MDGRCYCCGKVGHKSPQFQYNERPNSEWSSINKNKNKIKNKNKKANVQADAASKSDKTASSTSRATSGDKDRSIGWDNFIDQNNAIKLNFQR